MLLLLCSQAHAGTITGQIQTATGGAIANGTLTFTLSQPAVLAGTALLSQTSVSCYTSNAGNIVGVPDPLALPVLSTSIVSGTLPSGTYYVKFTYVGAGGESAPSPEQTVVLGGAGTVFVAAPVLQPANATGFFKVYMSTTSGAETLQGQAVSWAQFAQSTPLVNGATPPNSNTSSCSLVFSDQLIPTGTFYTVGLTNKNGSTIVGFPQSWCTYGGGSSTINVSQGTPQGNCSQTAPVYPMSLQVGGPGILGTVNIWTAGNTFNATTTFLGTVVAGNGTTGFGFACINMVLASLNDSCLQIGSAGTANSIESQNLQFTSKNSGGTQLNALIHTDPNGNFIFCPGGASCPADQTFGGSLVSNVITIPGTGLEMGCDNGPLTFAGGVGDCVFLGSLTASGNSVNSQNVSFRALNAGGAALKASISEDAAGDVVLGASSSTTLGGVKLPSVTFANLPASANGVVLYCSDCNATCSAGASNGRTCFRENGAWVH